MRDDSEALDMLQAGHGSFALLRRRQKGHAWQPNALQPAFEHGWWPIKPNRKDKYDVFTPAQRIHIRLHFGFYRFWIGQLVDALLQTQHGLEGLCV